VEDVVGLIAIGIEDNTASTNQSLPQRALRQDAMKCLHVSLLHLQGLLSSSPPPGLFLFQEFRRNRY
jgi:hypothetical protein